MAVIFIGIIFVMVFDINTQAAWAYAATPKLSILNAFILGQSFSFRMILTDTLGSRMLFSLILRSVDNDLVRNYRRKLCWIIVYAFLIIGVYKISTHLEPRLSLEEGLLSLIGLSFIYDPVLSVQNLLAKTQFLTKNLWQLKILQK